MQDKGANRSNQRRFISSSSFFPPALSLLWHALLPLDLQRQTDACTPPQNDARVVRPPRQNSSSRRNQPTRHTQKGSDMFPPSPHLEIDSRRDSAWLIRRLISAAPAASARQRAFEPSFHQLSFGSLQSREPLHRSYPAIFGFIPYTRTGGKLAISCRFGPFLLSCFQAHRNAGIQMGQRRAKQRAKRQWHAFDDDSQHRAPAE
ncbi:hypothetical protein V8C35DRAFT_317999 [Trichoderma chlorosporum]